MCPASIVAEADRKTVGFCFLSERDPIRAVATMVVDPAVHTRGIGRRLMAAVLERARIFSEHSNAAQVTEA